MFVDCTECGGELWPELCEECDGIGWLRVDDLPGMECCPACAGTGSVLVCLDCGYVPEDAQE